jgi:hypothetical protein
VKEDLQLLGMSSQALQMAFDAARAAYLGRCYDEDSHFMNTGSSYVYLRTGLDGPKGEFETSAQYNARLQQHKMLVDKEKVKRQQRSRVLAARSARLLAHARTLESQVQGLYGTQTKEYPGLSLFVDRYDADNESIGVMLKLPNGSYRPWCPFILRIPLGIAPDVVDTLRGRHYTFIIKFRLNNFSYRNPKPPTERSYGGGEIRKRMNRVSTGSRKDRWAAMLSDFIVDIRISDIWIYGRQKEAALQLLPATHREFDRYISAGRFISWTRHGADVNMFPKRRGSRPDFKFEDFDPKRFLTPEYLALGGTAPLGGKQEPGPSLEEDKYRPVPIFDNLDDEARYHGYADYSDYVSEYWEGHTGLEMGEP